MADQYKCDNCGDIAIRNHHTCKGPREFWINITDEMQKWYGGLYKYSAYDGINEEGLLHVREVVPCDCDPEVGFFCAHCANENSYIQDLQNQIVQLQDKIRKTLVPLEEIENDWICGECFTFDRAQIALQILRGDLEK